MTKPLFSDLLDKRPEVAAWLASLDEKTRGELRDDVTPDYKEVGRVNPDTLVVDDDHEAARASAELLDALDELRRTTQGEFFPELGGDARGFIMAAARKHLPDWKFRAFSAWFSGKKKNRIAKELGVSRSTVRSALDGEGHEKSGALASLFADEDFRKVVMEMAAKAKRPDRDMRVLDWFAGLKGNTANAQMVVAYAFLLILDYLADAKREVKIQDVPPHFPRNLITPCVQILRGEGMASSDGMTIRVHQIPQRKEFK